jgi:hypothetical protein
MPAATLDARRPSSPPSPVGHSLSPLRIDLPRIDAAPESCLIASGLDDDGSHDWMIPQAESSLARVKVVAHDDGANTALPSSPAICSVAPLLPKPLRQ